MRRRRIVLRATVAALFAGLLSSSGQAGTTLVVGDQNGGSRALMEAAGVLTDVPYVIVWKEFAAAVQDICRVIADHIEPACDWMHLSRSARKRASSGRGPLLGEMAFIEISALDGRI